MPGPLSLAYLAFAAIRRIRGRHLVVIDLLGLAAAVWFALDIPAGAVLGPVDVAPYLPAAAIPIAVHLGVNMWFGLYSRLWVHASVPDLLQVVWAAVTGTVIAFLVVSLIHLLTGMPSAALLGPSFWFLELTLALGVLGIAQIRDSGGQRHRDGPSLGRDGRSRARAAVRGRPGGGRDGSVRPR